MKRFFIYFVFVFCTLLLVNQQIMAQTGTQFVWYKSATSKGSNFDVQFGEYVPYDSNNPNLTYETIISDGMTSPFVQKFSQAVMRAINTLEATFVNTPGRPIKIVCVFYLENTSPTHATADPWWADGHKFSDMGETRFAAWGNMRLSYIDYVWKYGHDDFGGFYDVLLYFSSPTPFDAVNQTFGAFYLDESTAAYTPAMVDVESVTLHEIGHAIGFYGGTDFTSSLLDAMVTSRESTLQGGGTEWFINAPVATALNGGESVQLMPGAWSYDPHIRSPRGTLMADGSQSIGTARRYTDVELAIFQEMGWKLAQPINFVKIDSALLNGSISANKIVAKKGDEVKLTITPAAGYVLDELIVTCGEEAVSVNENSIFAMPSSEVFVSATFVEASPTQLRQTADEQPVACNGWVVYDGEFSIFDLLGRDVTHLNGQLSGIYLVRTESGVCKLLID